jgi:hypothetical protein
MCDWPLIFGSRPGGDCPLNTLAFSAVAAAIGTRRDCSAVAVATTTAAVIVRGT